MEIVLLIVVLCMYFLPTLIAMSRGKANGTGGVFFLNLLLGWTVVGWFVSFIWACSGEKQAEIDKRDRQHRELLEVVAVSGGNPVVLPPPVSENAELFARAQARRDARLAGALGKPAPRIMR